MDQDKKDRDLLPSGPRTGHITTSLSRIKNLAQQNPVVTDKSCRRKVLKIGLLAGPAALTITSTMAQTIDSIGTCRIPIPPSEVRNRYGDAQNRWLDANGNPNPDDFPGIDFSYHGEDYVWSEYYTPSFTYSPGLWGTDTSEYNGFIFGKHVRSYGSIATPGTDTYRFYQYLLNHVKQNSRLEGHSCMLSVGL